jgi:hypothetical protein
MEIKTWIFLGSSLTDRFGGLTLQVLQGNEEVMVNLHVNPHPISIRIEKRSGVC